MSLDMLLQILRTLEGLAAEVALVWLQWDVDTDVGSDMITLDGGGPALVPSTGQVEVICTLATDVLLADMFLKRDEVSFYIGRLGDEARNKRAWQIVNNAEPLRMIRFGWVEDDCS